MVTGFLSVVHAMPTLSDAHLGGQRAEEENAPALYIYFAQENETLYEIAKHYHVCPQTLSDINQCSGDALEQAKRLLVPRGM